MNTTIEKKKWPRGEAQALANQLMELLGPVCKRVVVAGSLRRGKAEVGDVELLYIPVVNRVPERIGHDDLFGHVAQSEIEVIDCCWKFLDGLIDYGVLAKRPSKTGVFTWGPLNKLAVHQATGIPVDFFATTEENWWTSLVVRTGGKASNLQLTTSAQRLGRKLHAYGAGVEIGGVTVRAESEEHLFELCGVDYLKPEDRP